MITMLSTLDCRTSHYTMYNVWESSAFGFIPSNNQIKDKNINRLIRKHLRT